MIKTENGDALDAFIRGKYQRIAWVGYAGIDWADASDPSKSNYEEVGFGI